MNENIHKALNSPLGFPSLAEILFVGDRILLVPDAAVVDEPDWLMKIVETLIQAGSSAEDISILCSENEEAAAETLRGKLGCEVDILIHRPARPEGLALLGVNENDQPIALCRALVDADMVITIGRHSERSKKDYFGIHTTIFPRLSDQETQRRFASTKGTQRRKLKKEVDEAAKLLGVLFTVQFIEQREKESLVVAGLPDLVQDIVNRKTKIPDEKTPRSGRSKDERLR